MEAGSKGELNPDKDVIKMYSAYLPTANATNYNISYWGKDSMQRAKIAREKFHKYWQEKLESHRTGKNKTLPLMARLEPVVFLLRENPNGTTDPGHKQMMDTIKDITIKR